MQMTVVVVTYKNRSTVGACLDGLQRQSRAPDAIVLVSSGDDGTVSWVREHHPDVRIVESSGRLFPGPAHNRGLALVRTEGVALLDADCVPDQDWLAEAERALEGGGSAVGGSLRNASPSGSVAWAYFLSEFTPWLSGAARTLRDMPTCNSAYRTELLRRAGGFTEAPILSADSLLHWTLRQRLGGEIRFVPRMRVCHRYVGSAKGLLVRRFRHGRSLAQARLIFGPMKWPRRCVWLVAGLTALPVFYALRLAWQCVGHPDVPVGALLRALPLTLLGLTLWAWGQAAGALPRWSPSVACPDGSA
jgi:GT2 family glycosyltransferase